MLSFDDFKSIAALKYDKGFNLLIECLSANIDALSNDLVVSEPNKELQILAKWRVYREIYTLLKDKPEQFYQEIEQNQQVIHEEAENKFPDRVYPIHKSVSPQDVERLKKLYELKTGRKVILT